MPEQARLPCTFSTVSEDDLSNDAVSTIPSFTEPPALNLLLGSKGVNATKQSLSTNTGTIPSKALSTIAESEIDDMAVTPDHYVPAQPNINSPSTSSVFTDGPITVIPATASRHHARVEPEVPDSPRSPSDDLVSHFKINTYRPMPVSEDYAARNCKEIASKDATQPVAEPQLVPTAQASSKSSARPDSVNKTTPGRSGSIKKSTPTRSGSLGRSTPKPELTRSGSGNRNRVEKSSDRRSATGGTVRPSQRSQTPTRGSKDVGSNVKPQLKDVFQATSPGTLKSASAIFSDPDGKLADLDNRLNRLSLDSPAKVPLPPSNSSYRTPSRADLKQPQGSRVNSPFHQPPPLFPFSAAHAEGLGLRAGTPSRENSPIRTAPGSPMAYSPHSSPSRSPRRMVHSRQSGISAETVEINIDETVTQQHMVFPDFEIERITMYPGHEYGKADIIAKAGDPECAVPSIPEKEDDSNKASMRDTIINVLCVIAIIVVIGLSYYFSHLPLTVSRRALSARSLMPRVHLQEIFELAVPPRVAQPPRKRHKLKDIKKYLVWNRRPDLRKRSYNRPTECTVKLMHHEFGWSYGKPFVGKYAAPPCSFTHVYFNISTTSAGRQFDRLGLLFFDDIEIWRTSTAEPTEDGIIFGYSKDMTPFSELLRRDGKLIFDLGNLVDDDYTGRFDVTLTATFYTPKTQRSPTPAHEIIPISAKRSSENGPSHFSVPNDKAFSRFKIPPNTVRAIVSVSASGNGAEEFWYTCVLNSFKDTFDDDVKRALCFDSPFREVQIYLDGVLVGAAWPYTTIYTGGLSPSFWRPIVGFGTYDVKEYEMDISPWLPRILDKEVEIEIKVVGWDEVNGLVTAAADWLVSGRVFVWKDPKKGWKTRGVMHRAMLNDPVFWHFQTIEQDKHTGENSSIAFYLMANRQLYAKSTLYTSSGPITVSCNYDYQFSCKSVFHADEYINSLDHRTGGTSELNAGAGSYVETYKWDLDLTSNYYRGTGKLSRANEIVGNTAHGAIFDATYGTHHNSRLVQGMDASVEESARYDRRYDSRMNAAIEFQGSSIHGEAAAKYYRAVEARNQHLIDDEERINGVTTKRRGPNAHHEGRRQH